MTDLRVVKRIASQEFSLVAPPPGHSRLWPDNRAVQAPVIAAAAAWALVREAGGQTLVQVDPQSWAIVGVHIAAFDFGSARKHFLNRRGEHVLLLDPEVVAG